MIDNVNIVLHLIFVTVVVDAAGPAKQNKPILLENYLPASMQALAYYIDVLQYEPLASTTVEPPFFAPEALDDVTSTSVIEIPHKPTNLTVSKPQSSTTSSWWVTTTTTRVPITAHIHKPGIYAPFSSEVLHLNRGNKKKDDTHKVVSLKDSDSTPKFPFQTETAFIRWLRRQKPRDDVLSEEVVNNNVLDYLPLSLVQNINEEADNQEDLSSLENLDNFLRNYDDQYGKFDYSVLRSTTGKKRIPPTKSYVEFLLTYDLLKRDAKAANLSRYEGYTDKMILELYDLSKASPQRQLYTLLKRMLDRREVQRADVVTRVKKMLKELGDGKSAISESLMHYPPIRFLP